MFRDQLVFINATENITSRNDITFLEVQGLVLPFTLSYDNIQIFTLPVQSRNISTSGNEGGLAVVVNDLKRTLNTIENIGHDTRTQLHRKRRVCAQNGITHSQTGWK